MKICNHLSHKGIQCQTSNFMHNLESERSNYIPTHYGNPAEGLRRVVGSGMWGLEGSDDHRERPLWALFTIKFLYGEDSQQQCPSNQGYWEYTLEASLHLQTDKNTDFIHIYGTLCFRDTKSRRIFFLSLYQLSQLSVNVLIVFCSLKVSYRTINLRLWNTDMTTF